MTLAARPAGEPYAGTPEHGPMGISAHGGGQGERAAARHLRRRGWSVLAERWRGAGGELDLVVARGDLVCAVEVKARADRAALGEPLTAAQRKRIRRALGAFLASRPDLAGRRVRCDLVTVHLRRPVPRVRHLPGAAGDP